MTPEILDKAIEVLDGEHEWFVAFGNGPFVFRFGPYTGIEVGEMLNKAIEEGVAITLICNGRKEFDWDLAKEIAPCTYPEVKG